MKSVPTEQLSFGGTRIRFDVESDAAAAFAPVARFFRHSLMPPSEEEATFVVHVEPRNAADLRRARAAGRQVAIRRSSAAAFNFDAWRLDLGDRWLYANEQTTLETPRVCGCSDDSFRLGIGPGATVQVVDFVRDLVVRHEESRGTVILHASAATVRERLVAIAGPKGAGKTTTLLTLLGAGAGRYFTGDKLFCRLYRDRVVCLPWRDWPYIGVGTLRHAALLGRQVPANLDARSHDEKLLFDPDAFERSIGIEFVVEARALDGFVLPAVQPHAPLALSLIEDKEERWAEVNAIVDRSADSTFFTWQSYLVPDYSGMYRNLSGMRATLSLLPMLRAEGDIAACASELAAAVTNQHHERAGRDVE